MVQSLRVGSARCGPVHLTGSGLRGPAGPWSGPALEAWRLAAALGGTDRVLGALVCGSVLGVQRPAAAATTGALLRAVFCQICHGATDCGAGARIDQFHDAQDEEELDSCRTLLLDIFFLCVLLSFAF